MFSSRDVVRSLVLLLGGLVAAGLHAQTPRYEGVGRTAKPAEVTAWDIDVRPDFKGLPAGQGSVKRGEQVWEAQCASCHGTFGESNDVFTPLTGATTAKDIASGRVASLMPGANATHRTTIMKASQLSSLWDYINRAMPWTAPKSLSADDVYAVVAYLLNLSNVVPADFTLSQANMPEVQAKLPNRNGMTYAHALWPGPEFGGTSKPDVQGSSCMANCATEPRVASLIPDYARNAHGNLADQSRGIGPTRGAQTSPKSDKASAVQAVQPSNDAPTSAQVWPILQKNVCVACHAVNGKVVGPSFREIADKYKGRPDAQDYLSDKIRQGGQGIWGGIPMPPQSIGEADARSVARWLAMGAAP